MTTPTISRRCRRCGGRPYADLEGLRCINCARLVVDTRPDVLGIPPMREPRLASEAVKANVLPWLTGKDWQLTREVAEGLRANPKTVSGQLARLHEAGLIERKRAPGEGTRYKWKVM